MPIVAKANRSAFLREKYPVLFNLCIADQLPSILSFRWNTNLPFCYGTTDESTPIPAAWDTGEVEVIPLWETTSGLIAVRSCRGVDEFILIYFENPHDIQVIARSLNGLFAYVFYFLIESNDNQEGEAYRDIEMLARHLGFHQLDIVVDAVRRFAGNSDDSSFLKFVRSL